MTDEDEAAYHRSARNMALVLAAMVITVFAALFVPPLVNPPHEQFAPEVYESSPYGFSLYLEVSPTSLGTGGTITVTAWLNNTGGQVDNVTGSSGWLLPWLSETPCSSGYPVPIGLGVLGGYYTTSNVTSGEPLAAAPLGPCSSAGPRPPYFAIAPLSTQSIVFYEGALHGWNLSSSFALSGYGNGTKTAFQGVYTVVAGDEWGDLIVTHFKALS